MKLDPRKDSMMTVKEVALFLNVHPNTIRRWCKDGRIKSYRLAPRGDRRFLREEIIHFLSESDTEEGNR